MGSVATSFARAAKDVPRQLLGYQQDVEEGEKGKQKEENGTLQSVVRWLSDWNLLAYLDGTGIFDPVRFASLHLTAPFSAAADLSPSSLSSFTPPHHHHQMKTGTESRRTSSSWPK